MSKLKSFEQFVSEMDRTEEIEQDGVDQGTPDVKGTEEAEEEAEEVQAAEQEDESAITEKVNAAGYIKAGKLGYNDQFLGRHSLSKTLSLDLGFDKKNEFGGGDWIGFDHISMYATGKKGGTILGDALSGKYTYDELKAAAAKHFGISESIEEGAGKPAEELKDETKDVTEPTVDAEGKEYERGEEKKDKGTELKGELKGEGDAAGEEIKESEEIEETVKTVAEMLTEIYEGACKNEAKAYEEDAHDEHTIESYMKENAALVGALASTALKNMKEEYSKEAYEAACNEMIEAYSKKVNEMKEMEDAEEAEDMNEE